MKNWYLYVLLCDQKTFYTGITDNLENRLQSHRNKQSLSTRKFSDVQLVYSEKFGNIYEAAQREKQIKGWSHAKKKALITGEL